MQTWGDTPEDALDILQGVAAAFVESYIDHGDELPPAVASALVDSTVTRELLGSGVTYRELTRKLRKPAVDSTVRVGRPRNLD